MPRAKARTTARPKRPAGSPPRVTMAFMVDMPVYERVTERAKREQRTVSEVLREVVSGAFTASERQPETTPAA